MPQVEIHRLRYTQVKKRILKPEGKGQDNQRGQQYPRAFMPYGARGHPDRYLGLRECPNHLPLDRQQYGRHYKPVDIACIQ